MKKLVITIATVGAIFTASKALPVVYELTREIRGKVPTAYKQAQAARQAGDK